MKQISIKFGIGFLYYKLSLSFSFGQYRSNKKSILHEANKSFVTFLKKKWRVHDIKYTSTFETYVDAVNI